MNDLDRNKLLVELKIARGIVPYPDIKDDELISAHSLYVIQNFPWVHGLDGIPDNPNSDKENFQWQPLTK